MRIRTSAAIRGRGQDEAVGADAEVAVADRLRQRAPVPVERARVDEDEVVAGAVELGEVHAWFRIARLTRSARKALA